MQNTESEVLTVSEITQEVKSALEEGFPMVQVIGELSNFKSHFSGHWYFSLKDSGASVSCAMWKSFTGTVFFKPQDGMKLIVFGRITVYPPRWTYQIEVRRIVPAGEGELQMAFEKLKKKLFGEGLFDEARKRPLPEMPLKIGVATAPDGAAFQDIISVARRRFPLAELVLAPCRVQGAGAAESIVEAISALNKEQEIEVIILARGGGSIEDLWPFNEEMVARAISKSKLPVITGVGHEVDYTIADFVADRRAPTPTAAMEIITPDRTALQNGIEDFLESFNVVIRDRMDDYRSTIQSFLGSSATLRPLRLINFKRQQVDYTLQRVMERTSLRLGRLRHAVELACARLGAHDVNATLKKGFVLVHQQGNFVKRGQNLLPHQEFLLRFFDTTVTIKKNEKEDNV